MGGTILESLSLQPEFAYDWGSNIEFRWNEWSIGFEPTLDIGSAM